MGISVRVTLDSQKINELVHRVVSEGTEKAANVSKRRVQDNIVRADRINTSAMLNSVVAREKLNTGTRCTWTITVPVRYAMWQERGVGPIFPVHAKALRFKPKGSTGFVFAKSTRGFQGAHFMQDALRAVRVKDFT